MSIFDKLKHAFHPVEQAVQHFSPDQVAHAIENGVKKLIEEAQNEAKKALPGHVSVADAVDIIKIAKPDAIDVDLFVGFGLELGVELDLEFDLGVTWEDPIQVVDDLVATIENPPRTVHQLLDRLWHFVPAEIRVYERLQAVIGEQGQIRWNGQDVIQRVAAYCTHKGWMEKKLR